LSGAFLHAYLAKLRAVWAGHGLFTPALVPGGRLEIPHRCERRILEEYRVTRTEPHRFRTTFGVGFEQREDAKIFEKEKGRRIFVLGYEANTLAKVLANWGATASCARHWTGAQYAVSPGFLSALGKPSGAGYTQAGRGKDR